MTSLACAVVQAFNNMIDRKMAASPVDGLIVYPEGEGLCTSSN